jgi:hypothetical protein
MEKCSICKFEGELIELNKRWEITTLDDGFTYGYWTYICPKDNMEIYVYTLEN